MGEADVRGWNGDVSATGDSFCTGTRKG